MNLSLEHLGMTVMHQRNVKADRHNKVLTLDVIVQSTGTIADPVQYNQINFSELNELT